MEVTCHPVISRLLSLLPAAYWPVKAAHSDVVTGCSSSTLAVLALTFTLKLNLSCI